MEHELVDTNGIRLHVVTAGPVDAEPVLLIHGFPETWYEWRATIPALEDRYRLIVPDTRGFGGSDKPEGPYDRAMLATDFIGVLDAFGVEQAAVVGHDWGGIIGFKLAIDHPERTTKLALLDTLCTVWPPGAGHGYWFKAAPRPEEFFARYHEQFIEQIFTGTSDPPLPGWPETPWVGRSSVAGSASRWATDDDVAVYKSAFADPGSHRAAITYYRDALAFHVVEPGHTFTADERYRALGSNEVAEVWEAGIDDHPMGSQFLDYGPEDRQKRYPHPTLWMFADPKAALAPGTIPEATSSSTSSPPVSPTFEASRWPEPATSSSRRSRSSSTPGCGRSSTTVRDGLSHAFDRRRGIVERTQDERWGTCQSA